MIVMNDFKKEYSKISHHLLKEIDHCLRQGWYILGKEVERFESNFAEYCGTKYCVGVANGLEAIQISLMALGIGNGDEVITVSNSAVATTLAITAVGATPIFVDVDEYHHMNVQDLEKRITPKTKAILPVHLYGQVCDMRNILQIAKKNHLFVIEDACQAHGASVNGKKAGSFGIMGCFSFYPTKNLGGYGDAGAITTNSRDLYEKCIKLRNYGQSVRYYHDMKGMNSRLDEIQAVILNFKLPSLEGKIQKRNQLANKYLELLNDIPQIKLPQVRNGSRHSFHLFVIDCDERDQLQQFLKNGDIESFIHYPVPIHKQQCYLEFKTVKLPETEKKAKRILSLPIHPELTELEVAKVCKQIRKFYEQ